MHFDFSAGRVAAAAALWALACGAQAQGTISSGSTFLQFAGTPFSTGLGNANLFFGSTSAFGTDNLYRYGWSYNQGVATSTRPFSSLDTPGQGYVGNVATLSWGNAGAGTAGFARWNAVMTITLTEIATAPNSSTPGAARVDTVLTFTANAGNSTTQTFNLFHQLDFDIKGTNGNNGPDDTYSVLDPSSATGVTIRAADLTGPYYAEASGAGASRYEFNTGSSLRSKLGETSGTGTGDLATLAGASAASFTNALDGAAAFQWTRALAPGESFVVRSSFTMNAPVGAVPEPASALLLAAGGLAVGLAARRRRRA